MLWILRRRLSVRGRWSVLGEQLARPVLNSCRIEGAFTLLFLLALLNSLGSRGVVNVFKAYEVTGLVVYGVQAGCSMVFLDD